MQILLRKEADTLPISNLWGSPFAEESTVVSNLLEEHSRSMEFCTNRRASYAVAKW